MSRSPGPSSRRLDPSLDFCDLCGAPLWRVFFIEIPPALMSPRLRAEVQRRRRSPDEHAILTVPLCQPCARLLGFAHTPEVAADAPSLAAALQEATPHQVGPAAEEALLTLVTRYEEQFSREPHRSSPPHFRRRPS